MGRVAALEVMAEAIALNRVRQNDGRLILGLQGLLVGSVNLAVVVATATEVPNLLVGHVLDQLGSARVTAEEVLAHPSAVVSLQRLVVAIAELIHQVD